jgi:hypothetical protein
MAGGHHFCENTVTVGGSARVDVTRYRSELGAEFLRNRADGRKYPGKGCTVNHMAIISFTTLNLKQATQSSSTSTLLGSTVNSPGVVLVVDDEAGGSVTHSLSPAECIKAEVGGGHAITSELDMAYEAVGSGGTEPTVTWAAAG